jgi:hypothetical protein
MGKASRQELVEAVRQRYASAGREDKRRILDEFVAVTGFHRKHSIRLLRAIRPAAGQTRAHERVYAEDVRRALILAWEASDRLCGKRLKAALPVLLVALERHGHWTPTERLREQLERISAATIDRLLRSVRAAAPGYTRRRPSATPALRRSVPVRTFADWNDPPPGYFEIDLVAHGGPTSAGSFVHTLTLTDIATGWTECVALAVREGALVVEGLTRVREVLPFPMLGVDSDNGSEFINELVIDYCRKEGIELTRSRPYKKNDQAWVEQKNGAVVRRLVGYRRLEGTSAASTLAKLYATSRLFVNMIQPSFKLKTKTRVGARVTKTYYPPETPLARLLASPAVGDEAKARIRLLAEEADPVRLLEAIRAVQRRLASLTAQDTLPVSTDNIDTFVASLSTAWTASESHRDRRTGPRPARHWRTRKDVFEPVWHVIQSWLSEDASRTAAQILQRLGSEKLGEFAPGTLRTLQRRVHEWRVVEAQRMVLQSVASPGAAGSGTKDAA